MGQRKKTPSQARLRLSPPEDEVVVLMVEAVASASSFWRRSASSSRLAWAFTADSEVLNSLDVFLSMRASAAFAAALASLLRSFRLGGT